MTDDRAREIVDMLRQGAAVGATPEMSPADTLGFLLRLYDDVEALKAGQAGLSFLNAGIRPVQIAKSE